MYLDPIHAHASISPRMLIFFPHQPGLKIDLQPRLKILERSDITYRFLNRD
jgi:hypothetical protein